MPSGRIVRTVPIVRTSRVMQLEGLFDVSPQERSEVAWDVTLPLDDRPWSVGLIVGPSGSGKTTIVREWFGDRLAGHYDDWPPDRSIVDAFPAAASIKQITGLLSSVGFSSPPSWLRPFRVLSSGEQFRVSVARALAEAPELAVIDEFTSVVDRTVAQIGSAAVAKTVRRSQKRLIAVTCHYDVDAWLTPDWVFEPHLNQFHWRDLQRRPPIDLDLRRVGVEAWQMFRQHHYLSATLSRSARCFLATWRGRSVAFVSVLPLEGYRGRWREHRTVTLPDFQGVGIGLAASSAVGAIVRAATGGSFSSTTTHPAFIQSRNRDPRWQLTKSPAMNPGHRDGIKHAKKGLAGPVYRGPRNYRLVASHQYIGPPWPDRAAAVALWTEKL